MDIKVLSRAEFRYRLGDIVLYGNDALGKVLHPDSPYHDTIGYDYVIASIKNNRFLDFKLLKKLIREHTQKHGYAIPPRDELVVHFRAGDWKRVGLSEVEILAACINDACRKSKLSHVKIVTAFHYGNPQEADEIIELNKDNYANLETLLDLVKKHGLNISVKPTGGIDEDFCYMANSRHYLPSKGGYSYLAAICHTHKVYSSFPETNALIRYYKKIRTVSFKESELLTFVTKHLMGKNYNPVVRILNKTQPKIGKESGF